jgi:hypothetical protein
MCKSYDLANAFGSGKIEDLHEKEKSRLEGASPFWQDTANLFFQKRDGLVLILDTSNGPTALNCRSGGFMGDANEPEIFMANFHDSVEQWITGHYQVDSRPLVARDFWGIP